MWEAKDLTGLHFGRLTVLERVENDKHRKARWLCVCDCGEKTVVVGSDLQKGNTQSCGCFHKESVAKILAKINESHGESRTRLYQTWGMMKQRCYNPKSQIYHRYGGRGITVCDEWRNDFEAFREWALSHGYAEGLTIDRIDVDGNYCPENCQWLTRSENTKKMHEDKKERKENGKDQNE